MVFAFFIVTVDNSKKESPSARFARSGQAGLSASNLFGCLANFFLFWNGESEMQNSNLFCISERETKHIPAGCLFYLNNFIN